MSRDRAWDSVQKRIATINELNIEPIIAELGLFAEYAPVFREIRHSLDFILRYTTIPPFPESSLNALEGELSYLEGRIRACTAYKSSEQTSPSQQRENVKSLINELDKAWANVLAHMMYFRCANPHSQAELVRIQDDFKINSAKLLQDISDKKEAISLQIDKVNNVSSELIENARKVAVANYVTHFKSARNAYIVVALLCLGGAFAFGWLIYAYSDTFLTQPAHSENWQQFWEHYLPRLFKMVVLLAFLVFALKQFQSAMHNVASYLHRKVIMQTFQAFRETAAEQSVKDAILLHAVRNAMDQPQTGYLAGQVDTPKLNHIGEIKKSITGD